MTLPPEWTDLVLPRRGNGVRRPAAIDPGAAARTAERIDRGREQFAAILDHPQTVPALDKAARAHLDGEPNPVGAAALCNLLRYTEGRRASDEGTDPGPVLVELFDALAAEHGTPFAVAAVIESHANGLRWFHDPNGPSLPGLAHCEPTGASWTTFADPAGLPAHLRSVVAETGDDEYRRIVERADAHRDTPVKRLAAALFLPDEADWVADACDDHRTQVSHYALGPLLWSIATEPGHVRRLGRPHLPVVNIRHDVVAALLLNLGGAALPVLAGALDQDHTDYKQRTLLYEAAGTIPTDEAARLLVDRAAAPEALAGLQAAATRSPARLARAAARADLAPVAAARLRGVLQDAPLDAVLTGLDPDEQAAVAALLADAVPVAGPARLPADLAAPPWTERPARTTTPPLEGLTAPADIAIVWAPGEHERALAIEPGHIAWHPETHWDGPGDLGLGVSDRFWARLAHRGEAAADAIVADMKAHAKYADAIVPIRSAAAAALVADWFTRLKSAHLHAVRWLDRHGEHAAPLLAPPALGGTKIERIGGAAALRHLGHRLGADTVLRALEPQGPEAVARVRDLLATHPHVPLSGQPPKPGPWADPTMLPPVMLRGGDAALPPEQVRHLIGALSLWSVRLPFPGVERHAEHCEPESLRDFSLALFELWLRADAPGKDSWAVDQLARFGDETTAAVLGPLTAAWPGKSQADRALLGIEVLAHIGTDTAFTHLHAIAVADRSRAVSRRARVLADRLAAARGLDPEAYADRLVPDHGVTDPAALAFDYGPRRFHVRFDHLLAPAITDETGKPRKALPKPGVRDDQALAKASLARYRRLVKTVATGAEAQVHRLRAAMHECRTWTPADFAALLAHPLVAPFAARLVWFSGRGFRIAEDGAFADAHDREFTPNGPVRVAHPALLGAETAAWTEILRDYEVLQPFRQLDQPAHALTEDELATGRLTRFDGATATYAALAEGIGWSHRFIAGTTRAWRLERRLPGGWLLADADPHPDNGFDPDTTALHTVHHVRLSATRNRHPDAASPLPGRHLDPVTAAELLADRDAALPNRLS
ncbi:DUF4132 domain-containing protein [Glycomyces paridis]|uniref:DUF4132 domain-containing protein n=1 Tax=Glycomyces paridis TaxID=2126555 RepID=UPI00130539F3|nr:DUF4132 domain-containing protein [Glycomyces paridis]